MHLFIQNTAKFTKLNNFNVTLNDLCYVFPLFVCFEEQLVKHQERATNPKVQLVDYIVCLCISPPNMHGQIKALKNSHTQKAQMNTLGNLSFRVVKAVTV